MPPANTPANLKRVLLGAREPEPITSFPQQSFVDLTDGERGIALINMGLPEYEVKGNSNTIALTLFRSVGWLARGDLLTRTGDAGPMIFTPEAECLREMEFNYALYFHKADWTKARVHQHAEDFNSTFPVIKTNCHSGELPDKHGFFKLESKDDVLKATAFKRSEDGEGVILRCYNPSKKKACGIVTTDFEIISAFYTDLKETVKEQIHDTRGKKINFTVKPKEIVTLKIVLQRRGLIDQKSLHPQHSIIWPDHFKEKEDFSAYRSMPVVTNEDISKENQRIEVITDKLEKAKKLSDKIEKDIKEEQIPDKDKSEAEHRAWS